MATEPVVKIERLTVRYGKLTAVDDLSLQVKKGKVYALLGRNGTGKSSTVRCLLGQQRATGGRARVLGLDSWKERRRDWGSVVCGLLFHLEQKFGKSQGTGRLRNTSANSPSTSRR